jgi:hypothetical protein
LRNVREHIAGFEAGQLAVLAHRDKEAVADTIQVLHETLDLVDQCFPQIDKTGVRQRLIITRTAHWPSERWHADEVPL